MDGGKLAAMLIIGFFAVMIGLTGRLGSLLGAIIDPANMQESSTINASGATGTSSSAAGAATTVTSLIQAVFGPYASDALKVAKCESGYNPNAVNAISVGGSHATGVFQILYPSTWNSTSYASQDPKDASANVKAAYEIFKRDGYSWREWACQP